MRKPKDIHQQLQALNERAQRLKARRVRDLGELVIATGADRLDMEMLAGALVAAAGERQAAVQQRWARSGRAFFQGTPEAGGASGRRSDGDPPTERSAPEV